MACTLPRSLPALDSEFAPLAAHALLLDVARAGTRLVAAGDRGHVLLSDDEGRTWRQVIAPTRAMLTALSFADASYGWAVGHDGVILVTADGGQTWTHQDSGRDLETIFLDVLFTDASHGWAVGAYGKFLATTDGGKSWAQASHGGEDVHVNQIARGPAGALYVAGEGGMLGVSDDGGHHWRRLDTGYEGSLFGVLPLDARNLLAYGLRGHVYASANAGESWTAREIPAAVLIMAGIRMQSGAIVLAGPGGNFSFSRDEGRTFTAWKPTDYNGGVSALLETADGALLVVGELGVARLQLPLK